MTGLDKMARENRERVMKLIDYRTEAVAHRDKLDIQKSAERVTAYSRVFAEDRDLYNLYRRVISVPVGKVSLTE
jgi:hypothetical protein